MQADGKVVVAGTDRLGRGVVVRLTRSGRRDVTFARTGVKTISLGRGRTFSARRVIVRPGGKLLVAGTAVGPRRPSGSVVERFALVQLLRGGGRDPAFGSGGVVLTGGFPSPSGTQFGFATLSDAMPAAGGRIIAAGDVGAAGFPDLGIARYLPDGRLDRSFGSDGRVQTRLWERNNVSAITATPGGGLIVAGMLVQCDPDANGEDCGRTECGFHVSCATALVRYTNTGSLDESFGRSAPGPGATFTDLPVPRDVVRQPGGSLLLLSFDTSASGDGQSFLTRFFADGRREPGVRRRILRGIYQGIEMLQQPDKRVVVLGVPGVFQIGRYASNARPDTGFGNAGTINTGVGVEIPLAAMARQRDGKLILAAAVNGHIVVARYRAR